MVLPLLFFFYNIILIGYDDMHVQNVITQLTKVFEMKDLELLIFFFLGLQIEYQSQGLFIHQAKYVKDLLQKVNMMECKPCLTPCHTNKKLLIHGSKYDSRERYAIESWRWEEYLNVLGSVSSYSFDM